MSVFFFIFQLLCCDMPNYHYEQCVQFNGDFGELLTCKDMTHSDAEILEGACGSGRDPDCEAGSYHEVRNRRRKWVGMWTD